MSRYAIARPCDAWHVEHSVRNRSRRPVSVIAILAMLVGLVTALTAAPPAGAALQPFTLTMTEGELQVQAAEDPLPLSQPTTITGQHDTGDDGTGAVTGGDLSTPPISFETTASGIQVFVTAHFAPVTPGSGTGSIDSSGNVSFASGVRVDLDLRLNSPTADPIRCTATPVALALDSTAPYDPETDTVTIRDDDFTVPPVQETTACNATIAGAVNDALAGSGNSIELTLGGALVLPPAPGCPSVTTLTEVTPSTSFQGAAVAMTATVVADPEASGSEECQEVSGTDPSGLVDFLSGTNIVGTAALDGGGVAQASITTLPLGPQAIRARYRGDANYSPSPSAATISHTVNARPSLVADLPPSVVIGAAPVEFDVTLTNTGLGAALLNARIDATFTRQAGAVPVEPERLTVEWSDGGTWVPAPLVGGVASVSPSVGVPVAPGAEVVQRVRISSPAGTPVTQVRAAFEVLVVDPGTGLPGPAPAPRPDALDATTVSTALVADARAEVTVSPLGLKAHTVRQGMTVSGQASFFGDPSGEFPTGSIRVLFDGAPISIRTVGTPPDQGYLASLPVDSGSVAFKFAVPVHAALGQHEITVLYSGDLHYEPASTSGTIAVVAPRGTLYECRNSVLVINDLFNVYVAATGTVPAAAPAGTSVGIRQFDLRFYGDRGEASEFFGSFYGPTTPVVPEGEDGFNLIDFRIGEGTGTATAVTMENNLPMDDSTRPVDPAPDMVVGFEGESASIPVEGDPGAEVPITLDSFHLKAQLFGGFLTSDLQCTPIDDPVSLGTVTVAGTTLSVDAPSPVREGDAVTLDAHVAPAGVPGLVEFRAGSQTIGSEPVDGDGLASMTTTTLPVGVSSITAIFRGGSLTLPSAPVEVEVRPEFECPDLTAAGAGRGVRWAFLSVLGRCPDAAAAAFWTPRFAASQTEFARQFSAQRELVRGLVDDGYRMVLERPADSAGVDYWADRLARGYRYTRFLAALAGSPEFSADGGSVIDGPTFVERLYERVLLREAEPAGLSYWSDLLAGGTPRWKVALAFTPVAEVRGRLVSAVYQQLLRRAPTASERARSDQDLVRSGSLAPVYRALLAGAEFAAVANSLPNP